MTEMGPGADCPLTYRVRQLAANRIYSYKYRIIERALYGFVTVEWHSHYEHN